MSFGTESLCQSVHKMLLAGNCPWCGCGIINGKALSPLLPSLPTLRSLDEIGERVKEEIVRRDPGRNFVELLQQCGDDSKKAIPLMIAALKDADWRVRRAAAMVLGCIGLDAKESLPILSILLEDQEQLVREAASAAINKIDK